MNGDYKHLIAFVEVDYTKATGGDRLPTYTTMGHSWAKITPLTGFKRAAAGQEQDVNTYEVKLRYRRDLEILTTWQIHWKANKLAIRSKSNVNESDNELVLIATEIK